MPPLIIPNPIILDLSFPRKEDDLIMAASALGTINELLDDGKIHVILSDLLADFLAMENVYQLEKRPTIFWDIFRLLNSWFLDSRKDRVRVHSISVESYTPHPIPSLCVVEGLVEIWAHEVGKLLVVHDTTIPQPKFCIGISCISAFSGGELDVYKEPDPLRAFPLVSPDNVDHVLEDAYIWDYPSHTHAQEVWIADAERNCRVIGAKKVDKPNKGTSHYKIHFRDKRPWILDTNDNPIPQNFLEELKDITGYPLNVIKFALINGRLPERRLRLRMSKD